MFRSQVQILSPQRITPDSLAIGSFFMPGIGCAVDSSYDRTVLYPGPLNVRALTGWMPAYTAPI